MLRSLLRLPVLLPVFVFVAAAFLVHLLLTGCEDAWASRNPVLNEQEEPT